MTNEELLKMAEEIKKHCERFCGDCDSCVFYDGTECVINNGDTPLDWSIKKYDRTRNSR